MSTTDNPVQLLMSAHASGSMTDLGLILHRT